MKAYINAQYQIKITPQEYLNEITLPMDMENWSKARIESYCYKPIDGGYSIYPFRTEAEIEKLEMQEEILNLQAEVVELEYQKALEVMANV